jgi:hypothetical protein
MAPAATALPRLRIAILPRTIALLRSGIPMKNRLSDLNDHLFAQLERLSDEGISTEKMKDEIARSGAVVAVTDQILRHATLQVQAAKILSDHGIDPTSYLPKVEVNAIHAQPNGMKMLNGAKQ